MGTILSISESELFAHLRNNFCRRVPGIDGDGIRRLFEIRKLAGDQVLLGKVALSRKDPPREQLIATLQIDEFYLWAGTQLIAIALFERRASQDEIALLGIPTDDFVVENF